jgi:nicotinamide mononucleotide adenylyltransferase
MLVQCRKYIFIFYFTYNKKWKMLIADCTPPFTVKYTKDATVTTTDFKAI